jgi:hypothetical protein
MPNRPQLRKNSQISQERREINSRREGTQRVNIPERSTVYRMFDTRRGDFRFKNNLLKNENFNLLLKFQCGSCEHYTKRVLHPSNFLLICRSCGFNAHLKALKSNFRIVLGAYHCQKRECSYKWVNRLPFMNIIRNTPSCEKCNQMTTRISHIFFRGRIITFQNELLYKCQQCSKLAVSSTHRKLPKENGGLDCSTCKVSMTFLTNKKYINISQIVRDGKGPQNLFPKGREVAEIWRKSVVEKKKTSTQASSLESKDISPKNNSGISDLAGDIIQNL